MVTKAVFFDIDGTLLNDRKRVSKSTQEAIQALKDNGIIVGLATGRGPAFAHTYMENLQLDVAVCYNGQYIFTRDRILYQNQLAKSSVYALLRYAKRHHKEVSLGLQDGLEGSNIISAGTSSFGQLVASTLPHKLGKLAESTMKKAIRSIKRQNMKALYTLMREPTYQVVMVCSRREEEELVRQFPYMTVTRSSPYSIDIVSKNQSKLKGIMRVGQLMGFDINEVMAFGDSDNDEEMISQVGVGVAMGNATTSLKEKAHFITQSNNQNGIAMALAHYGLILYEGQRIFESDDQAFNKVKAFHRLMDGSSQETPRIFDVTEAGHRSDFKVEEIVEFLYAAAQGDQDAFARAIFDLHEAVDKATAKVLSKEQTASPLVGEVDALVDLLYLTYGSFVLMGVDPKIPFDCVHEANMGKIFPDGKAHFDPVTHKILKPDDWEKRFAPEAALKKEIDRQIQKSNLKQASQESAQS